MSDAVRGRYHAGSILGNGPVCRLNRKERARWLYAAQARYDLKSATARVARALLRSLSFDGLCLPSLERLAEIAGCHRNSAGAAIRRLRRDGLLRWVLRKCQDGAVTRQTSNGYELLHPEAEEEAPAVAFEATSDIVVTAAAAPEQSEAEPSAPFENKPVLNKEDTLSSIVRRPSTADEIPRDPAHLDALAARAAAFNRQLINREVVPASIPRWKRAYMGDLRRRFGWRGGGKSSE